MVIEITPSTPLHDRVMILTESLRGLEVSYSDFVPETRNFLYSLNSYVGPTEVLHGKYSTRRLITLLGDEKFLKLIYTFLTKGNISVIGDVWTSRRFLKTPLDIIESIDWENTDEGAEYWLNIHITLNNAYNKSA